MKAETAFRAGTATLRAAGIDDPLRDARRLLDWAMQGRAETLDKAQADRFEAAIRERVSGRPVARIVGRRAFWKDVFIVTDAVLDPRPETETLVELALAAPFDRVLDLGTGSGCILLSLLRDRAGATGIGTDISEDALNVAQSNAAALGVKDRAEFRKADWFRGVEGRFDLIVSNPPYIAASEMADLAPEVQHHDPRTALTDGADGLSAYRAIAHGALAHLMPAGRILVEIGAGQGASVTDIFTSAGWTDVTLHPDLDGRDRVVMALAT
ncbi:modification methylase, HemK family protein [Oceaniovalibus guishaninsula JLT2003]|uniref:Release factor glutamine methyltransferase n=1 Tax=Oceaniovalibus guishaninsula JLT2003 TaxID=1231392 RepID=K2HEC1_9RHOB|nr:peptide chain release factor N(5)-glutamine methyltransferase [Oceaniovalibus guishaninsula]EKE45813.1 modification methylase, HemK family protein [Oceaniovalibus guishaninsula JLT2003]